MAAHARARDRPARLRQTREALAVARPRSNRRRQLAIAASTRESLSADRAREIIKARARGRGAERLRGIDGAEDRDAVLALVQDHVARKEQTDSRLLRDGPRERAPGLHAPKMR